MRLYEISTELLTAIENYNLDNTEEQTEAIGFTLESLQMQFNDKALGIGYYVTNEESDIESIDKEIIRLDKLRTIKENKIKWLKAYLLQQMEITNTDKIKSHNLTVAIRNNPKSVIIDDEAVIPDQYKKFTVELSDSKYLKDVLIAAPESKVDMSISKTKIKEALEQNVGVLGCHVEQKRRVDIK
jgi:hypothetical protein